MNQYPKSAAELPIRGTYFVSFWWAILWKELFAAGILIFLWAGLLRFFPDQLWVLLIFAPLTIIGVFYYLVEMFYAQLEKHYLRKNFMMVCVDKAGNRVEPKIEHARALLWSFLWGHLSLLLLAAGFCFVSTLALLFITKIDFWATLLGVYFSLFTHPLLFVFWAIVFSIYPHYWVWSCPFYNLAGFRFALVETYLD